MLGKYNDTEQVEQFDLETLKWNLNGDEIARGQENSNGAVSDDSIYIVSHEQSNFIFKYTPCLSSVKKINLEIFLPNGFKQITVYENKIYIIANDRSEPEF